MLCFLAAKVMHNQASFQIPYLCTSSKETTLTLVALHKTSDLFLQIPIHHTFRWLLFSPKGLPSGVVASKYQPFKIAGNKLFKCFLGGPGLSFHHLSVVLRRQLPRIALFCVKLLSENMNKVWQMAGQTQWMPCGVGGGDGGGGWFGVGLRNKQKDIREHWNSLFGGFAGNRWSI